MKSFGIISVVLLISFTHASKMVFEFGVDEGQFLYAKEGIIPLLKYDTKIPVPEPNDMLITHIKLTVDSLSPPKVDYDAALHQVSIGYTWVQVTASSYKLVVKGMPKYATANA